MLYSKSIFIPAGTSETSPIVTTFTIRERTVTRVDVMIDTVATKGLVGLKISIGQPGFKVYNFPIEAGDYIRKGETWIGTIVLPDINLPATITAVSPNAVKNHTAIVSIHTN